MPDRSALEAALEAAGFDSVWPRFFIAANADRILPVLLAHASDEVRAEVLGQLLRERDLRQIQQDAADLAETKKCFTPSPEAPDGED